jgi:hypothetical protein
MAKDRIRVAPPGRRKPTTRGKQAQQFTPQSVSQNQGSQQLFKFVFSDDDGVF